MKSNGNHAMVGEECIICNQNKKIGIHLYTSFICNDCEKEMIRTHTNDLKYKYFVQRLKRIKTSQLLS
ncbi:sigma factor G inhibitor Gin [Bacillus sp. FJAT-47783]|uniref:sigma factor G inhibitor Gin n=1 Tax=Bacillus sp. FJAT-47783 TaxID=2922712 RepID=UPI001FAC38BA|nr:sigma factor G inhibitor Gin [Bacillus sp. FJAT-47783]